MNRDAPTRVAWLASSPTPYKLPFFRQLKKHPSLNIDFFFCTWKSATRPWEMENETHLGATVLNGFKVKIPWRFRSYWRFNPGILPKLLFKKWDAVVICGYNHPTMVLAILCCWIKRIPFLIQGESHVFKPRHSVIRFIKRCFLFPLLRRCHAALATGTAAKMYFQSIGISEDHIFIVANTPDVEYFSRESVNQAGRRDEIRRTFNIPGDAVLGIFVGRLIKVKGMYLVLEALSRMSDSDRPHLLVVGDGPERESLTQLRDKHNLPVRFAGFCQFQDLPALYASSDFFILPSRVEPWGVVVNEAMACGLPAILSDQVGAAYDLLDDSRNGVLVRGGEISAWEKALAYCMRHASDLPEMGLASRDKLKNWTHEISVSNFLESLQTPPRRFETEKQLLNGAPS